VPPNRDKPAADVQADRVSITKAAEQIAAGTTPQEVAAAAGSLLHLWPWWALVGLVLLERSPDWTMRWLDVRDRIRGHDPRATSTSLEKIPAMEHEP
jgi:hypothetical protein